MANWFKNIFGRGSRSRAVVPAPPPTRTNIMYDAWQKVTNAPLTDFSPQELAGMKYSNRAGYMVELERLYSTMYHEWPTLQKDLSDVAESVAMLDWSVSPAVDDGGQPSAKAREVADVVSRAIWARLPQKPGTFTHGFLELIEAAVHGYYRGVNVHEIRWQFTKDLAFPAGFEPVWPQYYMWEMRCGEEDRLMMVPDGCDYSNPVPVPPHKFVLAMNNSGPDHPMYNGVLYSLLGYFLAAKCGLPWLQEYVLRYGHPVRKFKVQSKEDERKLREELELNDDLMDVFLRNGRELDITAIPAGANIPHEVLLKLAENMCHQVILGQTLTSDTSEDGGSRAQAQVHERVQNSVILKRAEWVCRLLNRGLVLDIVAMNYGEDALSTLPLPEIKCSLPDEGLNIDRVQVCKELLAIPGFAVAKSFIYEFLRIPMPAEGEDTFNTPEPPAHDHGGFGGLFGGMGGNTPPDGGGTPPKGTEDGTEGKREGSTPTAAQQRENERKSEQEGVNAANADPASMAREHDAATMALLPRVAGDWLAPVLDKLEDMLQAGMSPQQVYARLHELTPNTAALEQAMEAVLKSGLGLQTADAVSAAKNTFTDEQIQRYVDYFHAFLDADGTYCAIKCMRPNHIPDVPHELVLDFLRRKSGLGLQTDGVKAENPYGCNGSEHKNGCPKGATGDNDSQRHKTPKTNGDHKELIEECEKRMEDSHKPETRRQLAMSEGGLADVWNNLTEAEQDALIKYTDGNYKEINGAMREGKPNEIGETLRSILGKASLPVDIHVNRTEHSTPTNCFIAAGLLKKEDWNSPKALKNAVWKIQMRLADKEDIVLHDEAPLSTSTRPKLEFQDGDIERRIYAPKGSHGMFVDPVSSANDNRLPVGSVIKDIDTDRTSKESEVLFQPGTKTRLVAIRYDEEKKKLYTLEELI